jgi:predicted enzyme related to lactoylglutathione lyase
VDVRSNAESKRRSDYQTDLKGLDNGWDTFIHVRWDELDSIVEKVRGNSGNIIAEPFTGTGDKWEFKNACIQDPDGYKIILSSKREI